MSWRISIETVRGVTDVRDIPTEDRTQAFREAIAAYLAEHPGEELLEDYWPAHARHVERATGDTQTEIVGVPA